VRRRRFVPFVLAALALAGGGLTAPSRAVGALPPDCPATPCVVEREVPVPDGTDLGLVDTRIRVLLPSAYDGETRLPVVYLLHGAGDTYRTWVDNTDVETFAADLGVIVVMPDGGRAPESGWYSDWADGSRRWETFHIRVLVPYVDAAFATLAAREHRGLAGLSMGGFGATTYAGRHPGLFGAAASFSGALDTQMYGPAEAMAFESLHQQFGTPDDRVWGDGATAEGAARWAAHNPAALARDGKLAHLQGNLWLTTGTGTPGGPAGDDPANPGGYLVEQFVWQTNQSFELALAQSATPYHDLGYLGGPHDWPHWQHALHEVLPRLAAAIS
jgi:S-formylglutathione hydrolase FrmB